MCTAHQWKGIIRAAAFVGALVATHETMAAESAGPLEEIVVTAQKREQSVNDVGMTITAASGMDLEDRRIFSVTDLPRVVPGFTVQDSGFNSTSFTLRGVGFFNSDLGTPPAVTVYVDQAPIPYTAMTKLVAFDLERVEVLKGPQGTLFGQNATGGAINYLAAKPTDAFETGANFGAGRFDLLEFEGFVSGPVSDELSARVAFRTEHMDGWQKSVSRPDDRLGAVETYQARLTLDWSPTDWLTSMLAVTYTNDQSESQAFQFIDAFPLVPELAADGLLDYPVVTTPEAADWSVNEDYTDQPFPYASDSTLYHVNWLNDIALSDVVTLTSITSYADYSMKYGQDMDGTIFHILEAIDRDGDVESFFQELRVSGTAARLNWLVGANYGHDEIYDNQLNFFGDKDNCNLFLAINPGAFCDTGSLVGEQTVDTYGIFARLDYDVLETVNLEAGIRYNNDKRDFANCSYTNTEEMGAFMSIFQALANDGSPIVPIRPGDCYVLDADNNFVPVEVVDRDLDEDNVSWRVGVNWRVQPDTLVYANVSKGYKAGTVPVVGAATTNQFATVPQESVLAYEAGIKADFLERKVHMNAAAFYYDYKDKQLRGALLDAAFGPLEALVSIPKSQVQGAEVQFVLRPVSGLVIDASATYVDTEIDEFVGYDAFANLDDHSGTSFPFSPKWQSVTDVTYDRQISSNWAAFIGGTYTYNSKTYSGIGEIDIMEIKAFGRLDLRVGVETLDGRYRVSIWGDNVTDEYYWNNVYAYGSTVTRYAAMPRTYGATFSVRL